MSRRSEPVFYLIPGLGADERVFARLLPLLRGEGHVLPWLLPLPAETLPGHAARLARAIPAEQRCVVVGVSFGGVLAVEVCRLRPLAVPVLISSIPTADALPWLVRLVRHTGLHQLVPPQWLTRLPRLGRWYFGVDAGPDYQLFRGILRDTDPQYARWAIHQLLRWRGAPAGPLIRIHGTHDRVLPAGSRPVDYRIAGGTHFMIVSRGREISDILNQIAAGMVW